MVAFVIGGGVGHIASGVDIIMTHDLQIGIHMQAALSIARGVNLCCQVIGLHADGPDNCLRGNNLPIFQRYAAGVHAFYFCIYQPFDAQFSGGFDYYVA